MAGEVKGMLPSLAHQIPQVLLLPDKAPVFHQVHQVMFQSCPMPNDDTPCCKRENTYARVPMLFLSKQLCEAG